MADETKEKLGKPRVKVYIGYGWAKFDAEDQQRLEGHEVLEDDFWLTLRDKFKRESIKVDSDEVKVSCNRLRGTHGHEVWSTVRQKINSADVLIFDVASAIEPQKLKNACEGDDLTKRIKSFNANVLVEIGVALGKDKRVLLLCPKDLFDLVPSDLKGYLWSLYTLHYTKNGMSRKFLDERGLEASYRRMLRDAARDGLNPSKESSDVADDD